MVSSETERERELEALRTQVANQAASLAETVREGFGGFHMGAGDYIVDLKVPDGPSTGGGAQARQSIRLVPRRSGYAVVVVGTVDPVTSTAEVRTFDHVATLHELRFRRPLEVNAEEYAAFLSKLDLVFNLARVRSRRVPPPPDLLAQRKAVGKLSLPAVVVFVVVLLLAGAVVFRVMQAVGGLSSRSSGRSARPPTIHARGASPLDLSRLRLRSLSNRRARRIDFAGRDPAGSVERAP